MHTMLNDRLKGLTEYLNQGTSLSLTRTLGCLSYIEHFLPKPANSNQPLIFSNGEPLRISA